MGKRARARRRQAERAGSTGLADGPGKDGDAPATSRVHAGRGAGSADLPARARLAPSRLRPLPDSATVVGRQAYAIEAAIYDLPRWDGDDRVRLAPCRIGFPRRSKFGDPRLAAILTADGRLAMGGLDENGGSAVYVPTAAFARAIRRELGEREEIDDDAGLPPVAE